MRELLLARSAVNSSNSSCSYVLRWCRGSFNRFQVEHAFIMPLLRNKEVEETRITSNKDWVESVTRLL